MSDKINNNVALMLLINFNPRYFCIRLKRYDEEGYTLHPRHNELGVDDVNRDNDGLRNCNRNRKEQLANNAFSSHNITPASEVESSILAGN